MEKVYENALQAELRKQNLKCSSQHPIKVYYGERIVGEYFADLLVEEKNILELKASEKLNRAHELQLINYLKATDIEIGLFLNFGETPRLKRKIYTNNNR